MPRTPPGATKIDLTALAAQGRREGFLSRVTAAARYAIAGVKPDTWMSPAQPISPQAQEAQGRLIDYPVAYNLNYLPRSDEAISFAQLRALADNCDLARIAIETRKDQMVGLRWQIKSVSDDKDVSRDPRVLAMEQVFRLPDGRHTWQQWLRMVIEEVLVTDAPAIYPRLTRGRDVLGFEVMDGATLKVLTDADGRLPQPPSPAFQQRLKGIPAVDYTSDEIVYQPRNPRAWKFYGYGPVEQIAMTVNIAIRRTLSQLQEFTEGNIPEAFASLPTDWTGPQIKAFQEYWDATLEGDQAFKRKVKFVPGGTKVEMTKGGVLQDTFDEWLARVVTYAFSLPPTQFIKQPTRATSDVLQEAALDEGLAPLKAWVKDLVDLLIRRYFGAADLQFAWVTEEALDPQSQAEILTTYQKTGAMTANEVRAKIGMDAIEGGDVPLIFTATGAVPLTEAGKPPEPVPPALAPAPGELPGAQKLDHGHLHKADTSQLTAPMRKLADACEAAFDVLRKEVAKGAAKVNKAAATDADGTRTPEDVAGWSSFIEALDTSPLSLVWDDLHGTLTAVATNGASAQIMQVIADGEIDAQEAQEAIAEPVVTLTPEQIAAGEAPKREPVDLLSYRDPDAVQWAESHAADLISKDGTGGELVDATRNMLRRTLAQAVKDKMTDRQIADALQRDYAFSRERAELIARTEVRNAVGHGRLAGAQRVGMQSKDWRVSDDEGPCPLCEANQAQGWIPIDKPFVSGAMAPLQHPRCFIGSTPVSLPSRPLAASERHFNGLVTVIRTAAGPEITCTLNHPILTDRGWVPAGALDVGAHVVRYVGPNLDKSLIDFATPHDQNVPSSIQEVTHALWGAQDMATTPVPVAPEDFHGDGVGSEIAIVGADRELVDRLDATLGQEPSQAQLVRAADRIPCADGGLEVQLSGAGNAPSGCVMSLGDLAGALFGAHLAPAQQFGLACGPQGNSRAPQVASDGRATDPESLAGGENRLASLIAFDKVTEKYIRSFEGHVYNLETADGWYLAGGIVAHNCRCSASYRRAPAT